jgi:pimeloyl-ACP methyl ester carboxylesterase
MEKAAIGEYSIAYKKQGQGPPLILMHGGFSDSRVWRKQIDAFSSEYTVVAWDAPGCGQSSDPPKNLELYDYADCLYGLIEKLNLEHPHLLGLSFGGGLALEFYRRYPKVPRTLVLASAYAGWGGSLSPEEIERRLRRIQSEIELPPEQWVYGYLPTFFTKSVPQEVIDETVKIMLDTRKTGIMTMLNAFAKADLTNVLSEINIPTLLLYGEEDNRSPLSVARNLHANIPGSKLVVLPGVGHDTNLEAPEMFNYEVQKFLLSVNNG